MEDLFIWFKNEDLGNIIADYLCYLTGENYVYDICYNETEKKYFELIYRSGININQINYINYHEYMDGRAFFLASYDEDIRESDFDTITLNYDNFISNIKDNPVIYNCINKFMLSMLFYIRWSIREEISYEDVDKYTNYEKMAEYLKLYYIANMKKDIIKYTRCLDKKIIDKV